MDKLYIHDALQFWYDTCIWLQNIHHISMLMVAVIYTKFHSLIQVHSPWNTSSHITALTIDACSKDLSEHDVATAYKNVVSLTEKNNNLLLGSEAISIFNSQVSFNVKFIMSYSHFSYNSSIESQYHIMKYLQILYLSEVFVILCGIVQRYNKVNSISVHGKSLAQTGLTICRYP